MPVRRLKLMVALFFSFFISSLLILGIDDAKERSDILTYEHHYSCLSYDLNTLIDCQSKLGYPADILYQLSAYLAKFFLGDEGFPFFLFLISFIICFSILYFISINLKHSYLFYMFCLTDFRFYELGVNIIRNGLAISLVIIITAYRKKIFYLLAPLTHLSSAPYMIAYHLRLSILKYLFIFFLCLFFNEFIYFTAYEYSVFLPDVLVNKLYSYHYRDLDLGIRIPIHYYLILLLGIYLIKYEDRINSYRIYFNLFYVFLCISVLFSSVGMGYRFLNFSMPFAGFILSCFSYHLFNKYGSSVCFAFNVFLSISLLFLMFKNIEFISRLF